MDAKWIDIAGGQVLVPSIYQQVQSMPEDPEDSVPLMTETESSTAFALLYLIPAEYAMPYDNPRDVIDGIHQAHGDDQGLVEVKSAKMQGGNPFIYSIVKTKVEPIGVQYALTADIDVGSAALHAQGFFDEKGTTGMRAAMVYELMRRENQVGPAMEGWSKDPYDESHTRGFLANLSEREEFDVMFPEDPLSMARSFVGCLTSGL